MLEVIARKRRGRFLLDVSLELPTPGVTAVFGRSGSGKTTLVNIIAGLLEPDFGCVALDGAFLFDTQYEIELPTERRGIGYVFQDARLFPHLDVAANLRYAEQRAVGAPYIPRDTVLQLLDLPPLMNRRTHDLSGGERQRVAIGRALLSQPRLLLLDEPLASLDRARRAEVLPYLETLRDELAIPMIYVTHDFDEVLQLATHLVLIEEGSVTAAGAVGEMSLDPHLRSIIGRDEVGAIIDGTVLGLDAATGLTRVRVGGGEITVRAPGHPAGTVLRVQLLARDVIVSTQPPEHLSVRNWLTGIVTEIQDDGDSELVSIDIGAASLMARIAKPAAHELALRQGVPAWALLQSISLRGRSFAAARRAASPGA